jgi:hypothetical protein
MDVSVESFLRIIDEPNRAPAEKLWDDLKARLPHAAGSIKSHQAWEGGYFDHVQETMNIAVVLHRQLGHARELPFSLSSAILALLLHDCEKPFRHATDKELENFSWVKERPVKSDKAFQKMLIEHYGFQLSNEEWNALRYVEGVPDSEYVEGERIDRPLAAFCHCCDTISARIWHDYPKRKTAG